MPNPSPLKILVVDDNEANRYGLSRLLSKRGAEVIEAGNGSEALRLARTIPDLVVLDIHLPDMTGYEVLQHLRGEALTASLPVILMSALEPAPHARAVAQTLGVHSFLTFPVLSDDLWVVIQAALRKQLDPSMGKTSG
jgi:CheY-like chemotaxis protein